MKSIQYLLIPKMNKKKMPKIKRLLIHIDYYLTLKTWIKIKIGENVSLLNFTSLRVVLVQYNFVNYDYPQDSRVVGHKKSFA